MGRGETEEICSIALEEAENEFESFDDDNYENLQNFIEENDDNVIMALHRDILEYSKNGGVFIFDKLTFDKLSEFMQEIS